VIAVYRPCMWLHVDAMLVRVFLWRRSELDKSIADTERELSQCSTSLRAYELVGSNFNGVVQEFTELRSVIENKRWALHELKKHPLNASASDADRTLFSWWQTWCLDLLGCLMSRLGVLKTWVLVSRPDFTSLCGSLGLGLGLGLA